MMKYIKKSIEAVTKPGEILYNATAWNMSRRGNNLLKIKLFYKNVGRIPTDSLKNFFEIFGVPEIALQFLRISVG